MRRMNDFCYFVTEKMGFLSMEYFIKRPKIQRKRLYYGISKFLTLLPLNIFFSRKWLKFVLKLFASLFIYIDFCRKSGEN